MTTKLFFARRGAVTKRVIYMTRRCEDKTVFKSSQRCVAPSWQKTNFVITAPHHGKISFELGRNLATFNQPHLILEKLKVAMVFALELKLSKTLRGVVYFVLQL